MRKLAKMSLVAAVAVAGMTTTSSAANLEDAIKGSTLNGYVRYRYTNKEKAGKEQNEYKIVATLKSKVNDNVTAKIKFAGAGTTTDASGDANPGVANVAEANFIFNLNGTTVIAGKQALATPFADPIDQQGTGVVAVQPLGAVTLAGGLFTNSDAKAMQSGTVAGALTGNNIFAIAALGKADMVNYAVWYAQVSENGGAVADAGATAINANIKTAISGVNVEVNYATVDYTGKVGDTLNDQDQTRVVVSGKVEDVTLAAGVVIAGKDGADVTLGDTDASANFAMEAFDATILKDTTAFYLAAGMPVGPVNAKIEYGTASEATGSGSKDASETKISVAYPMSKNFTVSAWMTSTADALEGKDASRIEVKYTF
jgi:hypothetical protein